MGRRRAALFVDLDNGFRGLTDHGPGWLERLARIGLPEGDRRELLVRRCYLTPADEACLYFTQAGFEVVDCPPLNARGKNAADIRIALDMVDALRHPTHFDDFLLLSGDCDFTPVLQRVRAHDRRTIVVRSTTTTAPYEAVADLVVDARQLVPDPHAIALDLVLGAVAASAAPVTLSALGMMLRAEMGDVVTATGWFGRKTLSAALNDPRLGHLQRVRNHLWDPVRHAAPATS